MTDGKLNQSPWSWSSSNLLPASPLWQCMNISPEWAWSGLSFQQIDWTHTWHGWHWRYWGNQWLSYCSGGVDRRYLNISFSLPKLLNALVSIAQGVSRGGTWTSIYLSKLGFHGRWTPVQVGPNARQARIRFGQNKVVFTNGWTN